MSDSYMLPYRSDVLDQMSQNKKTIVWLRSQTPDFRMRAYMHAYVSAYMYAYVRVCVHE